MHGPTKNRIRAGASTFQTPTWLRMSIGFSFHQIDPSVSYTNPNHRHCDPVQGMGAAESRPAAAAAADDDDHHDDPRAAAAALANNGGGPARLVRVPGSLAGGQAELHAAVAALASRVGGPLPGAEDRGGIELGVRAGVRSDVIG